MDATPSQPGSVIEEVRSFFRLDPRSIAIVVTILGVDSLFTGLLQLQHGYSHTYGVIGSTVPGKFSTALAYAAMVTPLVVGGGLISLSIFLRYRYRFAWYFTIAFTPVTLAQSLLLSHPRTIVPLLVMTPLVVLVLAVNHHRFDRQTPLSAIQFIAFTALGSVIAYGTVSVYLLRRHFQGVTTVMDALFYVITGAISSFRGGTPLTSQAKLLTLSIILSGTIAFSVAFGSVLVPAIENYLNKIKKSKMDQLHGHVIVIGHSDMTERIIDEFDERTDFVLVTEDDRWTSEIDDEATNVLNGSPHDQGQLEDARIDDADRVVIASNDDGENALATLAVRELDPEIPIIASAAHHSNVGELERAGADTVISPGDIAGYLVGKGATEDVKTEDLGDQIVGELFDETVR